MEWGCEVHLHTQAYRVSSPQGCPWLPLVYAHRYALRPATYCTLLYIVPWKQPMPTDLVGRPVTSLLDEALSPIDREVFERQVRYHFLLQAPPSTEAGAAAPDRIGRSHRDGRRRLG